METTQGSSRLQSIRRALSSCLGPHLLVIYASLAALCYAIISVIVKRTSYASPSQLSLVANAGSAAFVLPLVVQRYGNLKVRGSLCLVLLTALVIATGLWINFYAYRWIPLGEVAVISGTTPLCVALIARITLGERLGLVQGLAFLVATAGVLLSVVPDISRGGRTLDKLYIAGVTAAVVSMVLMSIGMVFERRLRAVNFAIRVLSSTTVGALENALTVAFLESGDWLHCGKDSFLMVLMGLVTFLAECFLVMAAQVGQAGLVSLVKTSMDVVFGVLAQWLFFGHAPDAYELCGAALVLLSVGVIGLREWLSTLPEHSAARKKLWFLL